MTNVLQTSDKAEFISQADFISSAGFPISLATLARLAKKGQLPNRVKIGGRYFFSAQSIAEWKAERFQEARAASVASAATE